MMTHPILLNLPISIETPRLILRPPQAGDGEKIHQMLKSGYEDYATWLGWSKDLPNVLSLEKEARIHRAQWILREDMRLLMIDKMTGEFLGRLGIPSMISAWDVPMIGISYICAGFARGKGYVTEGVNALTRFAFEHIGAKKVQITCDTLNQKSMNVPKRLNFIHESTNHGIFPSTSQSIGEFYIYACFDPKTLPDLEVKWGW